MRPVVTVAVVVRGPIYERYFARLADDLQRWFFPGRCDIVKLPGRAGWPYGSASRHGVCLTYREWLKGEYVFLVDADMRCVGHPEPWILADGVAVAEHPGYPAGDPNGYPYERDPRSTAYVPYGEGRRYHPGAVVGGKRDAYLELAAEIDRRVEADFAGGVMPRWYEEAHLNRILIDSPPAVIMDRRYCWWAHWGPEESWAPAGAILVHLDKTAEEFEERGNQ